MDRTRFIEHQGKRILLLDYSGLRNPEDALREIERSKKLVALQPRGSLLVMTDVTGAHYDTRVVQGMKELASHNAPYVKASAVVGVSGLQKVVYSAVILFSKRKIQLSDTREKAMEWLVGQG